MQCDDVCAFVFVRCWGKVRGSVSIIGNAAVFGSFLNVFCALQCKLRDLGPTVQVTLLALHVLLKVKNKQTSKQKSYHRYIYTPLFHPNTSSVQVRHGRPVVVLFVEREALARLLQWLESMSQSPLSERSSLRDAGEKSMSLTTDAKRSQLSCH